MTCFVYVMGPKDGPQKIGIAKNPQRRLEAMQTANSSALALVEVFEMVRETAMEVETHAHWLLRAQHARGEWFGCSPGVAVDAVQRAIQSVRKGTAKAERSPPRSQTQRPEKTEPIDIQPLLARIGWSLRGLAGRLGCASSLTAAWARGEAETPPAVLAWLERVADGVDAQPPPQEWRRPRFGRVA